MLWVGTEQKGATTATPTPRAAPSPRPTRTRQPASPDAPPPRLEFLDGLRGLAALYVVIHHASQIYMGEPATPRAAYYPFFPFLILGHYAVVIFMVMSGYCLMLPVARSHDGHLRGGFTGYFARRAKRILPAYYAAVAFSLLLITLVPAMQRHDGQFTTHNFPGPHWTSIFNPGNLISHALVLHALSPHWINTIDSPLWSIGIEWICYFLMPLVLLPIWRRFGNLALLIGATAIAFLPYATIPLGKAAGDPMRFTMHWAHPWFIALFALGMAGAALRFPNRTPRSSLDQFLLNAAEHPLTLPMLFLAICFSRSHRVPVDFLIGLSTLSVILHCCNRSRLGNALLRVLHSRPLLALGTISYSLYLFHSPLLVFAHRAIEPLHFSPATRFALMLGGAVPLAVGISTVLYLLFERPFLSTKNAPLRVAAKPQANGYASAP
jgi:peptidoglycan/LPS O-acetylase OafA/YrhL